MAITRTCDYCEKPESEVGFVQSYTAMPSRKLDGAAFAPQGTRLVDLCASCAEIITRPSKTPAPAPVKPEPAICGVKVGHGHCFLAADHLGAHRTPMGAIAQPVVVIDGNGHRKINRIRNRPGRCAAYHPKSKSRCFWDAVPAHETHEAANGQRWPDSEARMLKVKVEA
jgi:hypothetical protein